LIAKTAEPAIPISPVVEEKAADDHLLPRDKLLAKAKVFRETQKMIQNQKE
jgi:hypothetical protein